jgi:hypothetical protein
MIKIKGKEFKTPGEFMDFTKTESGVAYVDNPEDCARDNSTLSTVFVETGYGWFWIDFQYESSSDEFFDTRALALEDLKAFRISNSA